MNNLWKQIIYAIVRIFIAVLLCLFVLILISSTTIFLQKPSHPLISNIWTVQLVGFVISLLVPILMMLALSKGRISTYGFKRIENMPLKRMTLLGLSAGIIATLLGPFIPLEEIPAAENFSFLQIIIFIWIFASIREEVLTRGLLQGFLEPLRKYGLTAFGLRISLPVLVSAFVFGLMHMGLLTMGMGIYSVLYIVLFAFIVGVIAGYYREKSGSLIPAIMVHMLANIGGTAAGYFMELFK